MWRIYIPFVVVVMVFASLVGPLSLPQAFCSPKVLDDVICVVSCPRRHAVLPGLAFIWRVQNRKIVHCILGTLET